jgi:hypothetical protein
MVASQFADSVPVNTIADLTKAGKGGSVTRYCSQISGMKRCLTREYRNHRASRVFSPQHLRGSTAFPCHCEYEVVMIRLAVAVAIVVASVPVAMAQGTPQERRACTRDAQRLCRQDLGNDGAVQNCLQTHRTRLSKACSRVFASHGM